MDYSFTICNYNKKKKKHISDGSSNFLTQVKIDSLKTRVNFYCTYYDFSRISLISLIQVTEFLRKEKCTRISMQQVGFFNKNKPCLILASFIKEKKIDHSFGGSPVKKAIASVDLVIKHKGAHTIRKCKKLAGQNAFKILLLNDANMIGEHQKTRIKMTNMCPFEARHFLIQVKKYIFSKGHILGIFILVSQCSPVMLASFKS